MGLNNVFPLKMAFPEECVGPICGAFLRRSTWLLSASEPDIPKIQYSVLTLKLLAEKNKYALHHMALDPTGQNSLFLKAAFGFMLNGKCLNLFLFSCDLL